LHFLLELIDIFMSSLKRKARKLTRLPKGMVFLGFSRVAESKQGSKRQQPIKNPGRHRQAIGVGGTRRENQECPFFVAK